MNNHCPIPIMRFRPDADGLERWLGPLEAAIMEVVYEVAGPCTVKRIWRHRHIDRKYTTVMTTMVRLARKGLLLRRRDGQAYAYIATCTEAEFVELQIAAIKRGIGE